MAKKFKILIGQEQEITFLIKAEHEDQKNNQQQDGEET